MLLLLAGPLIAWPLSSARSAPDPTNCSGYPNPCLSRARPSWWEPQNGPATHPGTGKQGHIHLETCFPAYGTFSGTDTIGFDLTIRLHNMPGVLKSILIQTYGDNVNVDLENLDRRCPTADCVFTYHMDVPLAAAQYSGLHGIFLRARVANEPDAAGSATPRSRYRAGLSTLTTESQRRPLVRLLQASQR